MGEIIIKAVLVLIVATIFSAIFKYLKNVFDVYRKHHHLLKFHKPFNAAEPYKENIIFFEYMGDKCMGYVYTKTQQTKFEPENIKCCMIFPDGSTQTKLLSEIDAYLKSQNSNYVVLKTDNLFDNKTTEK